MTALDYILDGLEAELALERELGVRSFEFDRTLLQVAAAPQGTGAAAPQGQGAEAPVPGREDVRRSTFDSRPKTLDNRLSPLPSQTVNQPGNQALLDFVFLHDRPLSPKGVEMMAKIILALGKTEASAPVVIAPPVPKAKILVVLGGLALKKFLPGVKGAPGQWIKDARGQDVLVTYSPEYILRFGTVTPAVKKIKQDMWLSLKSAQQRAGLVVGC